MIKFTLIVEPHTYTDTGIPAPPPDDGPSKNELLLRLIKTASEVLPGLLNGAAGASPASASVQNLVETPDFSPSLASTTVSTVWWGETIIASWNGDLTIAEGIAMYGDAAGTLPPAGTPVRLTVWGDGKRLLDTTVPLPDLAVAPLPRSRGVPAMHTRAPLPNVIDDSDNPFVPDQSVAGPGPKPATAATNAVARAESARKARLTRGYEAFAALLHGWVQQFDAPNVPQPDRAGLLTALASGPDAGAVLTYVEGCGGLNHAVRAVLSDRAHTDGQCARIADSITQATSILFPDLLLRDLFEPNAPRS